MKALLLAATSSLALTGFAMAQTATDAPAATTPDAAATAPAATGADTMTTTETTTMDTMTTAPDATATETTTIDSTTTTTDTTAAPAAPMTTTTEVVATDAATADVMAAPADATVVLTADNPGMLGSWIMNRRIWTTNQPSTTAWDDTALTERPAEWTDIAKVDDIVVDPQGEIVGYVADIGGFLGLGAKKVLLNPDALNFVQIGDDAFFATNYTREELEALPDFDTTTVMR